MTLEQEGIERWDSYRTHYEYMPYEAVAAAHDWVWDNYPDQSHHSEGALDDFFDRAIRKNAAVVEVGGWRGEAAARQLERFPTLASWENYEICRGAVEHSVPTDERYIPIWPSNWVWKLEPPLSEIAVLSHVIEHVSDSQLHPLLHWIARCGVRDVYIEAPLLPEGQSWMGGNTAHLLTLGWDHVRDVLEGLGFTTFGPEWTKKDYYHVTATR